MKTKLKTSKKLNLQIKSKKNSYSKSKTLQNKIPQHIWIIGIILSFFFFLLYFLTAPRTNVSYADSDELLAVAYNLGVLHPSGYPIYTLLLHFFTNLPIPGSVAFRGHIFTALLSASSLAFLFVTIWKLISYLQFKSKEKFELINQKIDPILFSALGIISLASSFIFWLYSIVTEKYSFTSLLISILFYFIVQFITSSEKRNFVPIVIFYTLLLSHHQTTIFLLPALIYFFYIYRKKLTQNQIIKSLISFFTIIFISLLILWLLNLNNTLPSWNFDLSIKGLINHVLRQDFSGISIDTGEKTSAYLSQIHPSISIKSISPYLKTLFESFGYLTILIMLISIYFLKKIDKTIYNIFSLILLFTAIIFPLYLRYPDNISLQTVIIRQYLMGFIIFPFFVSIGWWILLSRFKKSLLILSNKSKTIISVLIIIPILIYSLRIIKIYSQVNLKNYNFINKFHRQILSDLPQKSVLACFTDTSCFALLYSQKVEGFRKDIQIVPVQYPLVEKELIKNNMQAFNYTKNPYKIIDILTNNIDKRPTFVLDIPQEYYEILGLRFGFIFYIPEGYVGKLTKKIPDKIQTFDFPLSQELADSPFPKFDKMRQYMRASVARLHTFNSTFYVRMADRDEARRQLNLASKILYPLPFTTFDQINSQRLSIEGSSPSYDYVPNYQVPKAEEIFAYYTQFREEGKIQKAFGAAQGSITIDPMFLEGRLALADLYEILGDSNFAKLEYENVLKYYPENEIARQKVQELSQ